MELGHAEKFFCAMKVYRQHFWCTHFQFNFQINCWLIKKNVSGCLFLPLWTLLQWNIPTQRFQWLKMQLKWKRHSKPEWSFNHGKRKTTQNCSINCCTRDFYQEYEAIFISHLPLPTTTWCHLHQLFWGSIQFHIQPDLIVSHRCCFFFFFFTTTRAFWTHSFECVSMRGHNVGVTP